MEELASVYARSLFEVVRTDGPLSPEQTAQVAHRIAVHSFEHVFESSAPFVLAQEPKE